MKFYRMGWMLCAAAAAGLVFSPVNGWCDIHWSQADNFTVQTKAEVISSQTLSNGSRSHQVLITAGFVNSGHEQVDLVGQSSDVQYTYTVYKIDPPEMVQQGRLQSIPPTIHDHNVRPHDSVFYGGLKVTLTGKGARSISVVAVDDFNRIIGTAHAIVILS